MRDNNEFFEALMTHAMMNRGCPVLTYESVSDLVGYDNMPNMLEFLEIWWERREQYAFSFPYGYYNNIKEGRESHISMQ